MKRVVVIGAGISGLTAAWELAEERSDLDVVLLEAADAPGGTARSEVVDGVVLDHGANGFLNSVPETVALVKSLGLGDELIHATPAAKRRFLYYNGALCALPMNPVAMFTTPLLRVGSVFRAMREPWIHTKPVDADESVFDFFARRFGPEVAERFAQPFVTGIAADDAREVSVNALFPRVARAEREHGSVFRGVIAANREKKARGETAKTQLTTLRGGLGRLTYELGQRLGSRVRYGAPSGPIRRSAEGGWSVTTRGGDTFDADAVVVATPAVVAARLLGGSLGPAAERMSRIGAVSSRVVTFAFPRDAVPGADGAFGFLATPGCGLRLKGCIYVSSIFPDHAPADLCVLRCIVGGWDDEEIVSMDDADCEEIVLADLRRVFGTLPEPTLRWHRRWPDQIPQYRRGHNELVTEMDAALAGTGVWATGNSYRGISFNECIVDAQRVAREVSDFLR